MAIWSAEQIDTVTRLWNEGLSASVIGARMGGKWSRNAVIGKVHRLGLARRSTTARYAMKSKKRKIQPLPGRIELTNDKRIARRNIISATPHLPVATDIPPNLFKLLDWESRCCQWPYDAVDGTIQFGCTGDKLNGLPYCAAHAKRAYEPPKGKERNIEVEREKVAA